MLTYRTIISTDGKRSTSHFVTPIDEVQVGFGAEISELEILWIVKVGLFSHSGDLKVCQVTHSSLTLPLFLMGVKC